MEDKTSSTLDGAAGFDRLYNATKDEPLTVDPWDNFHEEEDYYEDECKCSDPGCPCTGTKIGGL